MDKNTINIDDLFRNRLGGGEEQEQAGSWGRMRELLDKEMPQRPAGMYWRRTLSAIAVLLLLSGIGAGGYITYIKNATKAGNKDLAAASADPSGSATVAGNNNEPTNNNNNKITTPDNKNIQDAASTAAVTSKATNSKTKVANNPVKENKTAGGQSVAINKKTADKNAVAATEHHADKSSTASAEVTATNTKSNKGAKVAKADKPAAVKANEVKTADKPVAVATTSNKKTANADKTSGKKVAVKELALGNSTSVNTNSTVTPDVKTKSAGSHNKVSNTKTVVSSNTPSEKSISGADADKMVDADKTATNHKESKAVATKNTTTKVLAANTAVKKTASKAPKARVPEVAPAADDNAKVAVVKNTRKAQRKVETLVLSQHFIKTSAAQGKFHLDTVSMETVTEEYEVAAKDANAIPYGPQSLDMFMATTKESSMVASAKEKAHIKKTQGSSSIENLNAAFNDMKNKVKGAHFAPGLNAGINGTFFGPNSFKGFQFGVTGNFSFSDNLSVMGELKYFHRINNNYSLNDDYYTYTPSTTGGYTKELVVNPYNFSTLHSIELPVSVRYCISNFNFFVGGNFVYSFSINTGATPLADPNTVSQVTSIENDNKPKIADQDFNSRFGFGYLVGASYQVSPNVMIDFRNVQTIWDNGNTAGAKIISGQLYKSPSLQLSIGYRLGGKKKDKE